MMPCEAAKKQYGYRCPVRGCIKKDNRRFSLLGLCMHIRSAHGDDELEKRLRAKKMGRPREPGSNF